MYKRTPETRSAIFHGRSCVTWPNSQALRCWEGLAIAGGCQIRRIVFPARIGSLFNGREDGRGKSNRSHHLVGACLSIKQSVDCLDGAGLPYNLCRTRPWFRRTSHFSYCDWVSSGGCSCILESIGGVGKANRRSNRETAGHGQIT